MGTIELVFAVVSFVVLEWTFGYAMAKLNIEL